MQGRVLVLAMCVMCFVLTSCTYTDHLRMRADLELELTNRDTSFDLTAVEYQRFHQIEEHQELLVAWLDTTGFQEFVFGEFLRFEPTPNDDLRNRRLDTLEMLRSRSPKLGPFAQVTPWDPYNIPHTTSNLVLDFDGEIVKIPMWRTDAIIQVKQQQAYNGTDWRKPAYFVVSTTLLVLATIYLTMPGE